MSATSFGIVSMSAQATNANHLPGGWLTLARAAWVALTIVAVMLFVTGTLVSFGEPLPHCTQSGVACDPVELTAEDVAVLGDSRGLLGLVPGFFAGLDRLLNVTFLLVGVVIFWRRADDSMALLFSITLVLLGMIVFTSSGNVLNRTHPLLGWLATLLGYLAVTALFLLLYLFPDGRFVPRWTPLVVLPSVVVLVISYAGRVSELLLIPWLVVVVSSLVYVWIYRYQRVSTPVERQQTKWVAFGLLGALGVVVTWLIMASMFPPDRPRVERTYVLLVSRLVLVAFGMIFPLATAFAILRYRLYDIDILINRTLVYGVLSAGIVGVYVVLVGALSSFFQASSNPVIALLATGLIALLVQPLRIRLQRSVNRLMYGERDDPYVVLSGLSQQLRATLAPATVLPTIVRVVARTLKLPYVAVALKHGDRLEIAATYGQPLTSDLVLLPLIYQAETVGQLLVAPRAPGEVFTPIERRLLDDIAFQAGVAVHAVQLTHDLQRSRERLVTTREEERRRLRRDLHDGLGPTLASLSMQLDVAQTLVVDNPAEGMALLGSIRRELHNTIITVRRLVYALRPPILDQFGLVAALREHALQLQGDDVLIVVESSSERPVLPAAVEVAAYYIAVEAMTNVARHAWARHCSVKLSIDATWLDLTVEDDGIGVPAAYRAGIGMQSMRERAAEVGGTFSLEAMTGGGTRIHTRFPCAADVGIAVKLPA